MKNANMMAATVSTRWMTYMETNPALLLILPGFTSYITHIKRDEQCKIYISEQDGHRNIDYELKADSDIHQCAPGIECQPVDRKEEYRYDDSHTDFPGRGRAEYEIEWKHAENDPYVQAQPCVLRKNMIPVAQQALPFPSLLLHCISFKCGRVSIGKNIPLKNRGILPSLMCRRPFT